VSIDGKPGDLIKAQRPRTKCRDGHGGRDEHVDLFKQLQERGPQAGAPMARLDIIDSAVTATLRNDVAIVVVGGGKRGDVAVSHGRRLFGIGDRL